MKIRYDRPLPKVFSKNRKWSKLISHEALVKITPKARLKCKLLVFENWKDMGKFFAEALGRPHAVDCRTHAICSRLDSQVESYATDPPTCYTMVDPNYFALIGFIRSKITLEVVAHECVHAGMAYAARSTTKWVSPKDFHPEEPVCYPVGKLTSQIWTYLNKENIIP